MANDTMKLICIYDKEMSALIHAIEKFKPYSFGQHFVIQTDHKSLKYLLSQMNFSEQEAK